MEMMIQPQQEAVKDLNWFLSEYDRKIAVITSNMNRLKDELHTIDSKKEEVVVAYQDIIKFKIDVVYSLLIKLEELIFNTTFAYYRKYHGSLRGDYSPLEFENTKREASYIFDSFLSQYKSLLDLSIKFGFELAITDLQGTTIKTKIDCLEMMADILIKKGNPRYRKVYRILFSSGKIPYLENILGGFINEFTFLEEIKDYRDYIIHHGNFKHQLKGKAGEGHIHFSYWIPSLIKKTKSYDIDMSSSQRLDHFCRLKFQKLLLLIAEMTDLIYDAKMRQPYISKIGTFQPELVKEVLIKISKKDFWADKVFFDDKEFEVFLKSKGIDPSELIEDFTYSELERENGQKGKKLLKRERVHYKPIGNLSVFRNRFIVNFEKKKTSTERLEKPSYGVTLSNLKLKEIIDKNPQFSDVLDILHRAGLVYITKINGETQVGCVRDDLKAMVFSLRELSTFKWSRIQIPEMKYFRPRTTEETEITRRILGDKTDEFLTKEDQEKKKLQKEYEQWKKKPIHYFKKGLDIVDEEKNIISRITHRDFLEEQKVNFQNWKQNKLIMIFEENGKTKKAILSLAGKKEQDQQWIDRLIKTCKKQWKGKPQHYLDFEKKMLRKSKKEYKKYLRKTREQFAACFDNYSYLEPILRLLNNDVFDN